MKEERVGIVLGRVGKTRASSLQAERMNQGIPDSKDWPRTRKKGKVMVWATVREVGERLANGAGWVRAQGFGELY